MGYYAAGAVPIAMGVVYFISAAAAKPLAVHTKPGFGKSARTIGQKSPKSAGKVAGGRAGEAT